jgi:CRISPR-associated protein Csx10
MSHYRYLPYCLRLNSPAVITTLGGDPNSSSTLSYIPGAAVRGAIAKALGDPWGDNARKQDFHDLVFGGMVRYLNAYPIINGWRALPTPVSLKLKKDEPENTHDVTDLSACDLESWPDEELIPVSEDFITIGSAQPALYSPKINSRIHNQRDREKGRAWKEKGAIFTFEFLQSDQMFGGLIQLCSEQEDELDKIESRVKKLLGETLLVGRSRRSGYGGLASIEWGLRQDHESVGGGKEGLRPLTRDIVQGEQFRLLLTSSCIVRNPSTGQPDPAALMEWMANRLANRVEVMRKVRTFELVGGFNRKWRLELPQTLAVSAGSAFVLKANKNISLDELNEIEHEGFGERKVEGYGRLRFLDKPLKKNSLQKFTDNPVKAVVSGQPPGIVTTIESRIVQTQLTRKIEKKAAELAGTARNRPTNSLIGRLRTPLRGEAHEAISVLKLWLGGNEAAQLKRRAMDQLERCKIDDGKDLRKWILDVMDRDMILNLLKVNVLAQRFNVVSEQSVKSGVDVKFEELSVRLIDAVLAGLAIRNKTQEDNDGH